MKTKLHSSCSPLHAAFAMLAALALAFIALPARAQDNVTISAADFQSMVYSAHLHTQLTLKPELEACLQTLLEMQRRNPNADPMALADVSRQALEFYRTNEPVYIRTNGYPDEILAAYLDALRHIPAHTNFVPVNLTMLNYFMLGPADYPTNKPIADVITSLVDSGNQRLFSSENEAVKRQALVDDCVARAQGNAAFASVMDNLLWPETGAWLGETPAQIIGDTNSPLHDDVTMQTLLALSQSSGNGSLTVSSNQLMNLFAGEMQTMWDTINTNLAVLAQINQSQPDYLAYLTNQAAIDANEQLQAAVQQGQPARLASATAAALVCSQLSAGQTNTTLQQVGQVGQVVSAVAQVAVGGFLIYKGELKGATTIMSGVRDGVNLLAGNPAQDAAATQLGNIQTMLGDLSTNINYRFDRVDQSLTTIYNTMNQQFTNIVITLVGVDQKIATLTGNVDDIRNSLVTVQSSLNRLEQDVFFGFATTERNTFLIAPANSALFFAIQNPGQTMTYSDYAGINGGENYENYFYTYAASYAKDDTLSPYQSLELTPSSLEGQLTIRPLEANLNYIKQYLSVNLGQSTAVTVPLPNPQEWFMGAYAYMQLAVENPMLYREKGPRLSAIIGAGQNLTNFLASLTFNGPNFNGSLYTALANAYFADLTDFNSQISINEALYANNNKFNVGVWRQWNAAAPRVTATATAMLSAPEDPSLPAGLTNVVAIAVGYKHSLALQADGTVVGWGYNYYGEATGVPNTVSPYLSSGPVTIAGQPLTNVVAIAAGAYHSLALQADGTVVGWGDNGAGGITIPAGLSNNVVAIAAGSGDSLVLKADGTVAGWGNNNVGQITIPAGLSNVVAIVAGNLHTLALKADGTVVGWGYNLYGETTGLPNTVSPYFSSGTVSVGGQPLANVVAIAAGQTHSLALQADGTVVGWGDDTYGQATAPANLTDAVAIAATGNFSMALRADGTVANWGISSYGEITIPASLTNVVAISGGHNGEQALFLTATNTGGSGASGGLSLILAELPVRLGPLFQSYNQSIIHELGQTGSGLDTAAANLAGTKLLLTDVLELGMPYTLAHDGVLHGFLYGSESLMDTGAATNFLQNQNGQLQAAPISVPQTLGEVAALRYQRFQDRLNQDLTNLQATGQPEIPRLVGQTLRLLNLLNDAYTAPTNSPSPALEISSQSNAPSVLLYGEPYMNYTLQYEDSLGAPGWTTTTLTNLQDGQIIIPPASGSPQRFYRTMLPVP